ncbi:MAG: ribonuclease P protein component, partial [Pseudomonadota bacterium]
MSKRAFVIEAKRRAQALRPQALQSAESAESAESAAAASRFGLTVTKKLGNAVVRNRIKRRLREAIRDQSPRSLVAGVDYVIVARRAAFDQPMVSLAADLSAALDEIAGEADRGPVETL